jgi:serine/threonine protein kinase/tetratricopeptide (TPR) repeat protein
LIFNSDFEFNMIADGKRLCETCGTRLLASILFCPVCALRTGLDSTEDDFTFAEPAVGVQNRFEHYEIVIGEDQEPVELGRGAMGVTYKANDTNLHCPVALKVINSRYLDDESVRQRFLTEARAAAGLRHANVASVFHLGTVEGDYFYAMEFVEGESLDRVLRSRGPLDVGLALEIVNQVASALSAGYRKGLVHRDIKPANLMVVFEEPGEVTVKVIDYGLVRTAQGVGSGKREAERFIGTPQFASPEQCAGKDADIRSDLYSLGVTLWVMLTGKLPFEGRFSELIQKHQVEPPPFGQFEHLPELVLSLLQFLLEKDPRKRPQTPLELRARVREAQKALASGRHPWSAASLARPIRSEPWTGESPYRGLQVFDVENEAIFFGRTKERDEILGTLQARSIEENRPFVLIFGASGCGKSSLLRAGVMPWLCRPGVIEGVDLWRSLMFRPSDYPGDLLEGLADALLSPGALPEIGADGTDSGKLAALLQKNPEALGLLVKEALSRAARDEQRRLDLVQPPQAIPVRPCAGVPIRRFASTPPVARLAIGLDQLEEIFTLSERLSPDSRVSFFKAVQALVEDGSGWVVATLRSDFFSRCEEIDELVELKQGDGQYHLRAPKAAQLSQMIRYPAEATGVVFEEHREKGPLGERIRDDALKEPGGLPLLEYALDELFRIGSADGVLSHADYEALGGVEGALRKRAEDAFGRLEPSEQAALGLVLHQVARLGSGDDETLTRRVASYETATAQPGARGLVDAFITARLLIADRDGAGNRTLTVAHEAWFRIWPEINRWEKENRDFLRVRARLGEAMARWIECNRQSDYLLAPGRPLAEAEELLKSYEASLEPEERSYILASRAMVARGVRRRRLIVAGVITALTTVAGAAVWEWRASVQSENRAISARGSAESILNYLLNQLSDKLKPIGHLDIVEDVQKQVETYYKNLGFSQEDPTALNNWATLLKAEGDRLRSQGDLNGAKAKYQQSVEIAEKLAGQTPIDTTWQRNLAAGHNAVGLILSDQGDWTGAKAQYQTAFEIARKLTNQDSSNTLWQRDVGISYNRLGNAFLALGDLSGAKAQYQNWLEIARKLTNQDPNNSLWQRDLEVVYNKLGDVLKAEGDLNGAKTQFRDGLEIAQRLAGQDSSNSDWQRDLTFSCGRLGDVLKAQGDLNAAKAEYQTELEVIQKLSKQDPANGVWQQDLADCYRKVGNMLIDEGDLPGAKGQFWSALEILQKLTKQDPTNGYWQQDLSASYEKLGNALAVQGDLDGAKTQYQRALDVSQKLTKQDPGNSDGQHGLSDRYKDLGILLKKQGDPDGARQDLRASRDILTNLIRLHGENPDWKADLDQVNKELGE